MLCDTTNGMLMKLNNFNSQNELLLGFQHNIIFIKQKSRQTPLYKLVLSRYFSLDPSSKFLMNSWRVIWLETFQALNHWLFQLENGTLQDCCNIQQKIDQSWDQHRMLPPQVGILKVPAIANLKPELVDSIYSCGWQDGSSFASSVFRSSGLLLFTLNHKLGICHH